ncbi:MAG: hypothetical protein AAFR87_01570 [Bacteroidota bacterium]
MKTSLRKIVRICAFTCITLISIACNPTCEPTECVPSTEEVLECDSGGGTYDYDRCRCE